MDSAEVRVCGGIGGLAKRYALASAGPTVRLLERAQQLGEVEALKQCHCQPGFTLSDRHRAEIAKFGKRITNLTIPS